MDKDTVVASLYNLKKQYPYGIVKKSAIRLVFLLIQEQTLEEQDLKFISDLGEKGFNLKRNEYKIEKEEIQNLNQDCIYLEFSGSPERIKQTYYFVTVSVKEAQDNKKLFWNQVKFIKDLL